MRPTLNWSVGSAYSFSRSPGKRIGRDRITRRSESGTSSSRFAWEPSTVRRLITRPSRCGSMAGFVTWAKCCLKNAGSSCGRSESTASGVSTPIEDTGSCPSTAIGETSRSRSSWV